MSEYQQYSKSPADYVNVLKRRKFYFLVPVITIFSLAFVIARILPTIYQSKATILIEEREVPREFISSAIGNYAAQQVQVISQRLLTVENVNSIADKFELYRNPGSDTGFSSMQVAQRFRDSMDLNLVDAEMVDPRSGRPTTATIAFTLAFRDADPATSQKVTEELVTLFLNENLRDRTEQARSTADFLAKEAEKLKAELVEVEQRLATFKAENEGSLPENYQFNLSILERNQRDISQIDERIQELEKRKIELSSQLAQLSPTAPLKLSSGDVVMSDQDRLQILQSEYRRIKAIYKDNHPDIVRLEREISTLQNELGITNSAQDLQQQLLVERDRLAELQSKYNDNHPEIVSARRIVAQLEESLRTVEPRSGDIAQTANNPAYVLLQTQLSTTESELRSLRGRSKEVSGKIDQHEALLKRAPIVEKEYKALLRDYESISARYRDISAQQRTAAMSINLEQEQKGERFTLIEPAALPLDPVSPNRPAIVYLGLVLGVGLGIACVILREVLDSAIHGLGELAAITGEPPLVVIPYIDNDLDIIKRQRVLKMALALALVAALVLCLHFFIAPLGDLFQTASGNQG